MGEAQQRRLVLFTDDGAAEQRGAFSQPAAVGALHKAGLL